MYEYTYEGKAEILQKTETGGYFRPDGNPTCQITITMRCPMEMEAYFQKNCDLVILEQRLVGVRPSHPTY